jgi:3-isopropylmalate dehydrogenase
MTHKIVVLPGDGIGPEIVQQGLKLFTCLSEEFALDLQVEQASLGGAAVDDCGVPLPDATLERARASDAILLGAVGGPKYDVLPREQRPERGLLALRSELNLFANLRPALLYPQLAAASTLKDEVVAGLDIMIVRELTGGIYFGQPRGVET